MKYLKKVLEIISICMIIYIVSIMMQNKEIILVLTEGITLEKVLVLLSILIIFLIIHIIRMFRIYILLVEEKISLNKFVKIYLKTTFINNIIPFKLGECYKILLYGEKLKSLLAGLSLVWLDRFFDSLILLALISVVSGFDIYSPIYIILVAFIVFSILAYTSFESTYSYFNTLILEKGISKRSKIFLEGIEEIKKLHRKAKNMVSFRGTTLIALSIIIWIFEYILAYLTLHLLFNMEFSLNIFTNYINGAFMFLNNKFTNVFCFNLIIMVIMFISISLVLKIARKGEKNGQ